MNKVIRYIKVKSGMGAGYLAKGPEAKKERYGAEIERRKTSQQ